MEVNTKKFIRFVANPVSGGKAKNNIKQLIDEYLDHTIYDYELIMTEYPNHATELSKMSVKEGCFAVVAIGGDGTINEVAKALVGSETALGVVPYGSGNGFSYHIGLRRDPIKGIKALNSCRTEYIDSALANGSFFLNVAGIGLDAKVAFKTKLNKRRGFLPYFLTTLKQTTRFKYMDLEISCPERTLSGEFAMAVVANGSIYGYDFAVAPEASLTDGLFDVILLKKSPVYRYFGLVPQMLNRTLHQSDLVEFIRTKQVTIKYKNGYFHLDGEGYASKGQNIMNFEMKHKSLLIIKAN